MCAQRCVRGGDIYTYGECGGGLSSGICAFSAYQGVGDIGFCTRACVSHDQCLWSATLFCVDIGAPANGLCFSPSSCPNGTSDCASDECCVTTNAGPFCLQKQGAGLKYTGGQAGALSCD
jgi:hypothetical protein